MKNDVIKAPASTRTHDPGEGEQSGGRRDGKENPDDPRTEQLILYEPKAGHDVDEEARLDPLEFLAGGAHPYPLAE